MGGQMKPVRGEFRENQKFTKLLSVRRVVAHWRAETVKGFFHVLLITITVSSSKYFFQKLTLINIGGLEETDGGTGNLNDYFAILDFERGRNISSQC